MEIETKTSFPTPRNRQEWRRRRFAQNSGICGSHGLQIKRGTSRCMRCRKIARP